MQAFAGFVSQFGQALEADRRVLLTTLTFRANLASTKFRV